MKYKSRYMGTVDDELEISMLNLYLTDLRRQHLGIYGRHKVLKV